MQSCPCQPAAVITHLSRSGNKTLLLDWSNLQLDLSGSLIFIICWGFWPSLSAFETATCLLSLCKQLLGAFLKCGSNLCCSHWTAVSGTPANKGWGSCALGDSSTSGNFLPQQLRQKSLDSEAVLGASVFSIHCLLLQSRPTNSDYLPRPDTWAFSHSWNEENCYSFFFLLPSRKKSSIVNGNGFLLSMVECVALGW